MFIFLFLIWLVLNGQVTLEIIIFGVIICAVLYWFCCRFMSFSFKLDMMIVRKIPLILLYIFNLVIEVIKSTFCVTRIVFTKGQPSPALVKFHSGLKSNIARVVFANSITLTPGTITVSLEGDEYTVHALDKSMAEGIEECSFVRMLRRIEEVTVK